MTQAWLRTWLLGVCFWAAATGTLQAQLLSPGDLSHVHAKLDGDEHCLECHSSGKRVDAQLCNQCHKDIGRALQNKKGLHGVAYRDKPCAQCHVEHRGTAHDLVRWPDGSREHFDHKLTGFLLSGAHAEVTCAKCHTSKNERGVSSFIGLATDCKSCHKDPHEGRLGPSCQKCHNEQSFRTVELKSFDHGLTRFPLKGEHNQVECKECHGAPPDTKYKPLAFEACTSCHKDPHAGRFSKNCTSCHTETSWKDLHMQRDSHPKLSLSGGHAQVACATCHDRGNDKPPSRGVACVSCHAPIHEAPFGKDCAACHKRITWLGVAEAQSREAHARTVFPLNGDHKEVACEECHLANLPLPQRYKKLQYERCADCHPDPHQGEFSARDHGECRSCHAEHGFVPTLFGLDQHSMTSFPLLGKHQAVACVACHQAAKTSLPMPAAVSSTRHAAPRGKPRAEARLNWHISGQACADCHDNPHGDQFASEMQSGGCAHCHNPNAWNLPSVDHSIWPLTGAHETAQCQACHTAADSSGQTNYHGVPRNCEGCHDDVHAGQFRLTEPKRACTDCHDTRAFHIDSFDHGKLTGYGLDGKHTAVPCSGCHKPESLHNGTTALRYRLSFSACADCHGNPHTQEAKP